MLLLLRGGTADDGLLPLLLLLLLRGGAGGPLLPSRLGRARHPMGVLLYRSPRWCPMRVLNVVLNRGRWIPPVDVGATGGRSASRRWNSCCRRIVLNTPIAPVPLLVLLLLVLPSKLTAIQSIRLRIVAVHL